MQRKHPSRFTLFIQAFMTNIRSTAIRLSKALTPGKEALKGAGAGIAAIASLVLIIPMAGMISYTGIYIWGLIITIILLAAILTAILANALLQLLMKLPLLTRLAVMAAVPLVAMGFGLNNQTLVFMLFMLVLFSSLAGGGIWLLCRWKLTGRGLNNRMLVITSVVLGLGGLAGGTIWLLHPGKDTDPPVNAAMMSDYRPETPDMPDPSEEGSYTVLRLSYGSGEDRRRNEYGKEADIVTPGVNGAAFLSSWEGLHGKLRTWYFGFDRYSLPLNAKVWYPEGEGPFPLVIAVHGNHLAQDWSEGGYAYLGELMASRGFIFVSVDQNFLNGSYFNIFKGLSKENDARGWLLLKHLQQWEEWNKDSSGPFFNMADMDNIALVGHSRGGEAVCHAALFNTLGHYPDDAREAFDFDFNIRAVVAIAPSDRQYEPAGTGTPVKDLNYLVLHGSHDADVQSFLGMRQYNRVSFSPGYTGFKSAVYIYRANHGQFNTSWGRKDFSSPRINLFNLGQLMAGEDQRQVARVYISAFLETSLRGKEGYMPLFTDHRRGRKWLPEVICLNQYEQAGMLFISDYNEDIDLTTATIEGGVIETVNLTVWREEKAQIKWGNQETRSAVIGWNNRENDSLTAGYSFILPGNGIDASGEKLLFMSLAEAGEDSAPAPLEKERDRVTGKNEEAGEKSNGKEKEAIDFTIELTDDVGYTIRFSLSEYSYLQPRLEKQMTKLAFMKTAPESETIFSFFTFSPGKIAENRRDFNIGRVKKVSLLFDRTEEGVIILSNIGLMPAV